MNMNSAAVFRSLGKVEARLTDMLKTYPANFDDINMSKSGNFDCPSLATCLNSPSLVSDDEKIESLSQGTLCVT